MIQRLDEEFSEDVPDRAVEETLVVEAEEGTPADLAGGSGDHRHRRRDAGPATDGDRVVAGDYARPRRPSPSGFANTR